MGDRANICIKDGSKEIYLYTHWSGTKLPATLQRALARGQRWDDDAYLTRIIFCEMVKGQEDGETGYGISATLGDGDDRILIVDPRKQEVYVKGTLRRYSFQEYVELSEATIDQLWEIK